MDTNPFDEMDGSYEPSDEDIREAEKILNENDREQQERPKNRLTFTFYSESHWEGWLRTNGIRWRD